ncbi:restriction endonuclease EcoRV family protein [Helicobacter pylori]|uniref:Restriction endonuclease EcoRV family protein n=1 Tax=Helicobacter pylori Hp H-45 TaxID=992050 RepID=J0BZU0_HELPX|nr:restriction endonuclease EcoRV family protein [Helicobacter pylori]EJB66968.1 restriction endonuclease EcoRV family protein [Helicobacter pylori Hp H-45]
MKQKFYNLEKLDNITSVIKDFIFFAEEKWKTLAIRAGVVIRLILAIGSIQYIDDILQGNGVFKNLGEQIFDEY